MHITYGTIWRQFSCSRCTVEIILMLSEDYFQLRGAGGISPELRLVVEDHKLDVVSEYFRFIMVISTPSMLTKFLYKKHHKSCRFSDEISGHCLHLGPYFLIHESRQVFVT